MDSEDIGVCIIFGILFTFFTISGVIIAIDQEYKRAADLKAMEMGYEQTVVDNQKTWRKINIGNNLVP